MAAEAVRLLLRLGRAEPVEAVRVELSTTLVPRASTAPAGSPGHAGQDVGVPRR
jgi:DNA-binding LacI/PurR family transcriptional regulator